MTYEILVTIDGVIKSFEIIADTAEIALNDVREAFCGEVVLLQYQVR